MMTVARAVELALHALQDGSDPAKISPEALQVLAGTAEDFLHTEEDLNATSDSK